jgi:Domain of unknown function (DUF4878)
MRRKPDKRTRRGCLLAMAAVALMAVGLTGCGAAAVSTGSFTGEKKAVAQRISDFQADATAADHKKICQNDLAATTLAKLRAAGGDCESELKSQLAQVDILELTIESIQLNGDKASATVKSTWSGKSRISTMELSKEGSSWKISGLA